MTTNRCHRKCGREAERISVKKLSLNETKIRKIKQISKNLTSIRAIFLGISIENTFVIFTIFSFIRANCSNSILDVLSDAV